MSDRRKADAGLCMTYFLFLYGGPCRSSHMTVPWRWARCLKLFVREFQHQLFPPGLGFFPRPLTPITHPHAKVYYKPRIPHTPISSEHLPAQHRGSAAAPKFFWTQASHRSFPNDRRICASISTLLDRAVHVFSCLAYTISYSTHQVSHWRLAVSTCWDCFVVSVVELER